MRYDQLINAKDYDLKAKFDYYNRLCFNGALPNIPLRFARLKGNGGLCGCKYTTRGTVRTIVPDSIYITMDRTFLRDEQAIDAILVHEMIHAWFYVQNDLREDHGMKFQDMRRKLSAIVGFTIPTTEKMTDPVLADIPPRALVVFVRFPKAKGEKPAFFISSADYARRKAPEFAAYWEANAPYYDARFMAYDITSPAWTQKAARMRLQRPVNYRAATFYVLQDESLLADLNEHGKVLFDLTKVA